MRVRMGWSGETESNTWQKFDIELEHEDLERVLMEHGFEPTIGQRLPTQVCYQLLQNEAERLLVTKLTSFGYPADKATSRIAVLVGQTRDIVGAINAKLAAG